MYAVNISDELGGGDTYRAEDLCHYTRSQHLLLYDGLGNRFLRYSNANDLGMGYSDRQSIVEGGSAEYETYLTGTRNNRDVIESIGEGNSPNVFDPENIPSGFVIDDMSRSIGDLMTNIVATGHTGNTLHIYEFCMYAMVEAAEGSATLPYCSNSWTVSAAGDLSWQGAGHHIVLFYEDHILCGWKQYLQGGPYRGFAFFGTRLDCRRSFCRDYRTQVQVRL